ncbi:MAG: TetR/AcrR family transcriptional regulator [Deltaproteobacteria bacterium]|nr:TetR/AcrR family transcriptional regulator [Deltaproteobacteria bacterium]
MARRRAKKRDESVRANQILTAADALFGEQGYDAISVRDVAEAAGVNKALVFYYFDNKEALFERVMARYYAAHEQALRDALAEDGTVAERLHRLMDGYVDFIATHQNFPRFVQQQVASRGPALTLIGENLAGLQRFIEQALGDLVPATGPLAARQFFLTFSASVINHFTYAEALAPAWGTDPLSAEGIAERRAHLHWLVDALLAALEKA